MAADFVCNRGGRRFLNHLYSLQRWWRPLSRNSSVSALITMDAGFVIVYQWGLRQAMILQSQTTSTPQEGNKRQKY